MKKSKKVSKNKSAAITHTENDLWQNLTKATAVNALFFTMAIAVGRSIPLGNKFKQGCFFKFTA